MDDLIAVLPRMGIRGHFVLLISSKFEVVSPLPCSSIGWFIESGSGGFGGSPNQWGGSSDVEFVLGSSSGSKRWVDSDSRFVGS